MTGAYIALGPPLSKALDLCALAQRKAPPREWDIDQWAPKGQATLVAGLGGVGKSLLEQQVATAQSIERDYIGRMRPGQRVMVWNCEDTADELWRRQETISEYFGIALDAPADRLHLVSRFGRDNTLMAPLLRTGTLAKTNIFDELSEQIQDERIDSLWLDNVGHVYGGDESNRGQVTTFINMIIGMAARPLTLMLVSHTARAQGSEYAGSAAWENACRARWYFGTKLPDQKDEGELPDPHVRFLARRKSNYSANDHVRMTYRGGVFVPDQVPDRIGGLVAGMDDRKAEEIIVAGYRSLCNMGIKPTDAKNSPDYLPKQVHAKGLGCGYSVSELARAVNRLMAGGVFERGVIGTYANRSPKEGLLLKELI